MLRQRVLPQVLQLEAEAGRQDGDAHGERGGRGGGASVLVVLRQGAQKQSTRLGLDAAPRGR